MASADKTKLDGIAAGAQVNVPTNLGITNGTTNGPVVTSSTGTNATIPAATASISGAVSTAAQTFAGNKTFGGTANTQLKVSTSFSNSTLTGVEVDTVGDSSTPRFAFLKSGAIRGSVRYIHNATGANEQCNINVAGNDRLICQGGGAVYVPAIATTASAANCFLNSASSPANSILRSTSSLRYKTDIENLEPEYSDAVLNLRPVWYRSLSEVDRGDWSWYGLIAEETAEIDPRLVHWTYLEDSYEEVDGERKLKADAELVPDGVQYDRVSVLLLDVVKRLLKRIEVLESRSN
jgi:hypothetical protein